MKIAKKKPVKEVVKAKAKAVKAKVRNKIKGSVAVMAAILGLVLANGCMDTAPASRATTATFGDIGIRNEVKGSHSSTGLPITVTSTITIGDNALASADSTGSTETQTATPTIDVRTRIDARYNDAISGATAASKSTLGLIGDGVTAVLDMMASKKSGTVAVTKTDGSAATVRCENGQCSFCEDCTPQ